MRSKKFYAAWLKHAYVTDDGRLLKNVPMLAVNYAVTIVFLVGFFYSFKDISSGVINFASLVTVTLCFLVMLAGSLVRYKYLYPYRVKKLEDVLYTLAEDFGLTDQLGNKDQSSVSILWNGRDIQRLTVNGRKGSPITKSPKLLLSTAPRIDFALSNGIPNRRGRLPKPRTSFHWIYDMDDLQDGRLTVRAAKEKNPEVVETKQKIDIFYLIASMFDDMETIPRVIIPRGGSTLEVTIPQWVDSLAQRTLFMEKFNRIFAVRAPYVWDFLWGGASTVLITLLDESTVEGMMHAVNRVVRQTVEQAALKGFTFIPAKVFIGWDGSVLSHVHVQYDGRLSVMDENRKKVYEDYMFYALRQLAPTVQWMSEWKHDTTYVNTWYPAKTE